MHTFYENVKLETASIPATATAQVTGASMDISGTRSPAVVVGLGNSGDLLGVGLFWRVSLEDSADNVAFVAVAAADVKALVDNTAATVSTGVDSYVANAPALDSRFLTFEYKGLKRYVRAIAVPTGAHVNGTPISMLNVFANSANLPVV